MALWYPPSSLTSTPSEPSVPCWSSNPQQYLTHLGPFPAVGPGCFSLGEYSRHKGGRLVEERWELLSGCLLHLSVSLSQGSASFPQIHAKRHRSEYGPNYCQPRAGLHERPLRCSGESKNIRSRSEMLRAGSRLAWT